MKECLEVFLSRFNTRATRATISKSFKKVSRGRIKLPTPMVLKLIEIVALVALR